MPKLPVDLRQYRRQSERNFLIAVIVLLAGVGSILIGLIYGWPAIFTAALCLLPGLGILVLLWLFLWGVEKIIEDNEQ